MTLVPAADLDAAVACLTTALRPAAAEDWTTVPGTGDLDGWHTAEHVGDCLLSYAAQLVSRRANGFVPFLAALEKDASSADALEFAAAGGAILAATVRGAPPEARAFHPTGTAAPAGFAAMGCAEVLVHGEDVARALGLALDPPREVCARTVARLFPTSATCRTWTRGRPCDGRPTASRSRAAHGRRAGAGTALPWTTEDPGHPRQTASARFAAGPVVPPAAT